MDLLSLGLNLDLLKLFAQNISSFCFHGKLIVLHRQFFGKFLKPTHKNYKIKNNNNNN